MSESECISANGVRNSHTTIPQSIYLSITSRGYSRKERKKRKKEKEIERNQEKKKNVVKKADKRKREWKKKKDRSL